MLVSTGAWEENGWIFLRENFSLEKKIRMKSEKNAQKVHKEGKTRFLAEKNATVDVLVMESDWENVENKNRRGVLCHCGGRHVSPPCDRKLKEEKTPTHAWPRALTLKYSNTFWCGVGWLVGCYGWPCFLKMMTCNLYIRRYRCHTSLRRPQLWRALVAAM